MKLAWFTPFSKKSAIGMVSKTICEELSKTIDVTIWTHHKNDLADTSVKVIHFTPDDKYLADLKNYDFIIYNMGNFAGNHREIYDVSQKYSGVVVLHDQTMSGFWGQYFVFKEFGGDPVNGFNGYVELFRKYYGTGGESDAISARDSGEFAFYEHPSVKAYRLIEPVINNSIGVFTHARFFCDELKKIYNGPLAYSYLPCQEHCSKETVSQEILDIISNARKKNKKIIVSNGIVHPVKQIDKVVDVLLQYRNIAEQITYLVIGDHSGPYGEKLCHYADNELKGTLYMLGYRNYEEMNMAINAADLCFNLRYPNSEVCSLSLLEQMQHKKGIVVIDSGIYGEMPDECVIKIQYSSLTQNIHAILKQLCDGASDFFSQKACAAKKFIGTNCTVESYCHNLLNFLAALPDDTRLKAIQDNFITSLAQEIDYCKFGNMINTMSYITNTVADIFNEPAPPSHKKAGTLGIWAAFDLQVSGLRREGISRFIEYLMIAYAKRYNAQIEFWCYSFNKAEAEAICSQLPQDNYLIITEQNWTQIFTPTRKDITELGEINASFNNLNRIANKFSQADIMIPIVIYLDSVIATGKRIFVPGHDMAVSELFCDFLSADPMYKFRQADIAGRAENLAKAKSVFFSNSNSVKVSQNLKYIRNLTEEHTAVIYYPTNVPPDINDEIISYDTLARQYGIRKPYIFYPTQIRPYKNVETLIKAFSILQKKLPELELVLTGNPKDIPEVQQLIEEPKISKKVKIVRNVPTNALYSLYKYAEAVPVPSVFEGGFPYQACEALYMGTPVVMADIEVTRERIEFYGFTSEQCGISMFPPYNADDLANKLYALLNNRDGFLKKQEKFAKVLLGHSWEQTIEEYHNLFECT